MVAIIIYGSDKNFTKIINMKPHLVTNFMNHLIRNEV